MKKLKLSAGRATACLIVMCLILVQGCRKDRFNINDTEVKSPQLINEDAINKWYETNPMARYIALDWGKARQAVIDGQNVVRVPTLNVDKLSALTNVATLKKDLLASKGLAPGIRNKTATGTTTGGNSNYYTQHPPEVFFMQEPGKDKLNSFLLNFIPTDKNREIGENGIWTGKLLEWNLTGDTIFVQEIIRSTLKRKYAVKIGKTANTESLSTSLKDNKLQSLSGLKDRTISNFWSWLGDKLGEFVGWVGSLFGLSTYNNWAFDAYNGSFNTEWQLDISWDFLTGNGDSEGGGGGGGYTAAGMGIYGSYNIGYIGDGANYNMGGTDPNNISYTDYKAGKGGPNFTPPLLTLDPDDYIVTELGLTGDVAAYLMLHVDQQIALNEYLNANGWTYENKEFVKWAAGYLTEKPSMTIAEITSRLGKNSSKYILDNAVQSKYPKFASIVKGLGLFLASNPKVISALSTYSGFSKNKIFELVTNGSGPTIKLSSEPWTKIANGLYNYKISNNTIFLSEENVAFYENNFSNYNVQNSLAFSLMVTIFHETVHYGRFVNGLADPDVTPDYGTQFEELGFGFNVEFRTNQPVLYKMYYLP